MSRRSTVRRGSIEKEVAKSEPFSGMYTYGNISVTDPCHRGASAPLQIKVV